MSVFLAPHLLPEEMVRPLWHRHSLWQAEVPGIDIGVPRGRHRPANLKQLSDQLRDPPCLVVDQPGVGDGNRAIRLATPQPGRIVPSP